MSNATNFSGNLRSKRIFLDQLFLLSAVADDAKFRLNNFEFLFCREIAPSLGLKLLTSDLCWRYARENRGSIIQVTFNENEALIFPPIEIVRSEIENPTGLRGLTPSAETCLNDAISLECGYVLTLDPDRYAGSGVRELEVLKTDEFLKPLLND